MPTYQYECQTCQVFFEVKRSFKEVDKQVLCPACEGTTTRRIVTGGQAVFLRLI